MNIFKQIIAIGVSATFTLQAMPLTAYGEDETTNNQLTIAEISSTNTLMSSEYWANHRISTNTSDDTYIASYTNNAGQYYSSSLDKAFDGNWSTHWETGNGNTHNYVDITFNKAVTIDRMLYATRQDGAKPKGYPENLTIYSYNSSTEQWDEVANGTSTKTGGYVLITLPQATTFEKLRFDFTQAYNGWASASEFVFLRPDNTVIDGSININGTPLVGETLTAIPNLTVGDNNNINYQWQYSDNGVDYYNIENATNSTYKITEKKNYFRVNVTDSNKNYYGTLSSNSLDYSKAITTGSPQANATLTASIYNVDKKFTCKWQISDSQDGTYTDIEKATAISYTLTESDVNKYIKAILTLTETGETLETEPKLISADGTYNVYTSDYVNLSELPSSALIQSSVGYDKLRYNENIDGNTISLLVNNTVKKFSKGLSAHAAATLVYDVSFFTENYQYNKLTAWLGVDKSTQLVGDGVKFYVYTSNDNSNWTLVESTDALMSNSEAVYIDINIKNVKYVKFYISSISGNSNDHSVIAGAKLSKSDYTEGSDNYDFIKTISQYDKELRTYENSNSYESLVNNEDYRKLLYQRTFVNYVDYDVLQSIAHDSDSNKKALEWFMNDFEALDYYINGGPIVKGTSYQRSVNALINLYTAYSGDMDNSLYKRLLIALALVNSEPITSWVDSSTVSDPVRRYGIFKKLYNNGYLVNNIFENLSVAEMKWVVNNRISDEEIEWLNYFLRKDYYKNVEADSDSIYDSIVNNKFVNPYNYITYGNGYNYSLDKYYSEENKAKWQEKYHLVNTDDTDDDNFDISVTYESGHPRLWIVFEEGSVCGGIAGTGANFSTVFGVPSMLVGQPGHAAYFRYRHDPGDNGQYKLGIWELWNDVYGWSKTWIAGGLINGWGTESWCSAYQGNYLLLVQAALNDYDNYIKAEDFVKMASTDTTDTDKVIELCEKALSVQNFNVDAWELLINAYVSAGKSEDEFLNLAQRVTTDLKYYPHPMRDIVVNLIQPNISTSSLLADCELYLNSSLTEATKATKNDTLQPSYCKDVANYILGNENHTLASFSFSGDSANKIMLTDTYKDNGNELLYSIDGGTTWINAGMVNEYQLSNDEISKITADNDILVKLQGSSNYYTIDIKTSTAPKSLFSNDNENKIFGTTDTMEWSTDKITWESFNNTLFTGDKTVYVRTKANGTTLPSDSVLFNFTADSSSGERTYITIDRITVDKYSSAHQNDKAENTIDGNINTIWHSEYSNSTSTDSERYISYKFNKPIYLSAVDYTPRQSGQNGIFTTCEIYTSLNGTDWKLATTATGLANNASTKSIDLDTPVYANYVKVVGKEAIGNFGSASMIEFFENTTIGKNSADLNNDGENNSIDVATLLKYVSEMTNVTIDESKTDINGDGKTDIADVIALAKYIE